MADQVSMKKIEQLEDRIVAQVQHYLNDANLRWDKFMREKLEEGQGSIKVSLLVTFKKLLELLEEHSNLAALTGDSKPDSKDQDNTAVLMSILERKVGSEQPPVLFTLDKENSTIVKTSKFENNDSWFDKTVHLKFKNPNHAKPKFDASCFDDLKHFFGEFGTVELIRQRRYTSQAKNSNKKKSIAKDSFLIEFATPEQATAAVNMIKTSAKTKNILGIDEYQVDLLPKYTESKAKANEFIPNELRKPGVRYPSYVEFLKFRKTGKRSHEDPEAETNKSAQSTTYLLGYKAYLVDEQPIKEEAPDAAGGSAGTAESVDSIKQEQNAEPKLEEAETKVKTEANGVEEEQQPADDITAISTAANLEGSGDTEIKTESVPSDKGQDQSEKKNLKQDKVDYKIIREAFRQYGNVLYVKKTFGTDSGAIVFKQPIAHQVFDKICGLENQSLVFDGVLIKPYILSAEQEAMFSQDRRAGGAAESNSNKRQKEF